MAGVIVDPTSLAATQQRLQRIGNAAPLVLRFAINDTLQKARTQISREVRADVTLAKAKVDQQFRFRLASATALEGVIYARNRGLLMTNYGARPIRAGGISVQVKRGGPRKRLPGAFFLGPLPYSGATGVFIREKGTRRLIVIYGPSVPQIMGQEIRNDVLQQRMLPIYVKQVEREARAAALGVGRYAI